MLCATVMSITRRHARVERDANARKRYARASSEGDKNGNRRMPMRVNTRSCVCVCRVTERGRDGNRRCRRGIATVWSVINQGREAMTEERTREQQQRRRRGDRIGETYNRVGRQEMARTRNQNYEYVGERLQNGRSKRYAAQTSMRESQRASRVSVPALFSWQ